MMLSVMIIISSPIRRKTICDKAPSLNISPNADFDNRINNNSWGMMIGNPKIAISAAFWLAFSAMAAKKVKTKLIPVPPKIVQPKKRQA